MTAKKAAKKSSFGAANSDTLAGAPAANPPGFSNPATRALRAMGVTRLSQLTEYRESDISKLHGVGPKGVAVLKAALKAAGKSFRR
jgi:hypothetical protein